MAYRDNHQPPWQAESCPTWCRREHLERDHPEDRVHQSAAVEIAGVRGERGPQPRRKAVPTQLVVWATQHVEDPHTWVRLEDAETGTVALLLTVETASAVSGALAGLLGQLEASQRQTDH